MDFVVDSRSLRPVNAAPPSSSRPEMRKTASPMSNQANKVFDNSSEEDPIKVFDRLLIDDSNRGFTRETVRNVSSGTTRDTAPILVSNDSTVEKSSLILVSNDSTAKKSSQLRQEPEPSG